MGAALWTINRRVTVQGEHASADGTGCKNFVLCERAIFGLTRHQPLTETELTFSFVQGALTALTLSTELSILTLPNSRTGREMTDGIPDHALRLHQFVRELQVYAGAVGCSSTPRERLRSFETLLDLAPAVSQADRVISERLLAEALRRLYVAFRLPNVRITADRLMLADLRREFTALCRLRRRASARHVARFFEVICEGHSNPELLEEDVGRELGISVRHLSRLVNRETGRRFDWHVRAARVHHAAQLLVSSKLSMKEIAAAAGFSGTSELDHQFHAVHGVSPSCYRETNAGDSHSEQQFGD